MARTPKFKYAWQAYLERQTGPHDVSSCRVGDLFTCASQAERTAKATFGFKSGRFETVVLYKVRVSLGLWQKLNATEIAA